MTILSDKQIRALCTGEQEMISPYSDDLIKVADTGLRALSSGQSSYGYDVKLGRDFKYLDPNNHDVLDPLNVKESDFLMAKDVDYYDIPPHGFVLGPTREYFNMPKNVTGLVLSKSTYLRAALYNATSVIEAGWKGVLVVELFNLCHRPVRIWSNQGVAQILFLEGEACDQPYDDTRKYQGQTGITLGRA